LRVEETMKASSGKSPAAQRATIEDIRRYFGDIDDTEALQIHALEPTIEQLEEAALWLTGEGDRLSREGRPLAGPVAAIFDILSADEEEEPRMPS
jgi:hypothetical protein